MKRRNSAFPKVTITSLLEVTHVLWLDFFALSHDLWLDFALQITPKSLSVSLLLSPSVSLSHILPHMFTIDFIFVLLSHILPHMFPICFQCVLHVFCCCILFALPPNQAVLTVLICSFNFSHTLCQMFLVLFPEFPFIPRVVPAVPMHPHVVPNSTTAASSNVSSTQFEF